MHSIVTLKYLFFFKYRTGATDHPSSKKPQKSFHLQALKLALDFSSNFYKKNSGYKFREIFRNSLSKNLNNFHVKNYLFLLLLMIPPRNVSMQKHFFQENPPSWWCLSSKLPPKCSSRSVYRLRIALWRQINHLDIIIQLSLTYQFLIIKTVFVIIFLIIVVFDTVLNNY